MITAGPLNTSNEDYYFTRVINSTIPLICIRLQEYKTAAPSFDTILFSLELSRKRVHMKISDGCFL